MKEQKQTETQEVSKEELQQQEKVVQEIMEWFYTPLERAKKMLINPVLNWEVERGFPSCRLEATGINPEAIYGDEGIYRAEAPQVDILRELLEKRKFHIFMILEDEYMGFHLDYKYYGSDLDDEVLIRDFTQEVELKIKRLISEAEDLMREEFFKQGLIED